jgi:hypothetical protein
MHVIKYKKNLLKFYKCTAFSILNFFCRLFARINLGLIAANHLTNTADLTWMNYAWLS